MATTLPSAFRYLSAREVAERLAAERRGVPFLLLLDAHGRQRIIELPESSALTVGRGPASDVALPWDTEVSRAHAVLERIGDEWTVLDEGLSRNGSFVNGERLRGHRRLRDGDAIKVGHTLLVFRAPERAGARTTEVTPDLAPPTPSAAQRRVLEALCAQGRHGAFAGPPSNREIAAELVLSVETVKTHMRALFELFDVGDLPQNRKRLELVRRAIERGAVRPDLR
jgi:pSer/pThr/pTyr-binding forkhead associated (FHA) protein